MSVTLNAYTDCFRLFVRIHSLVKFIMGSYFSPVNAVTSGIQSSPTISAWLTYSRRCSPGPLHSVTATLVISVQTDWMSKHPSCLLSLFRPFVHNGCILRHIWPRGHHSLTMCRNLSTSRVRGQRDTLIQLACSSVTALIHIRSGQLLSTIIKASCRCKSSCVTSVSNDKVFVWCWR